MFQGIKKFSFCILLLIFTTQVFASDQSKTKSWLNENSNFSLEKLAENISPNDAAPGAVIAARNTTNPNYYYHWVRDAALVMDALIDTYKTTNDNYVKQMIRKKMFEYLGFSTRIQNVYTQADLGEP